MLSSRLLSRCLRSGRLQSFSRCQRQLRSYSAQPTHLTAPLNVLFFGSDEFSMPSLQALYNEHLANPDLIASLCVCHRSEKEVTRKGKRLLVVPIHEYAKKLQLPTIGLDTFPKDFPIPENCLIITASFGLFVPERVLSQSPFPGLNVHPSLLPQLRGSAPIQWAIMSNLPKTGVSVQTMSTKGFDKGLVLSREEVYVDTAADNYTTLRDKLAPVGARLLLNILRERKFREMKGLENEADESYKPPASEPLILARKLNKQDSRVNWEKMTVETILRLNRAFPSVWTRVEASNPLTRKPLVHLDGLSETSYNEENGIPGEWRYIKDKKGERMLIRAKDGWVRVGGGVKLEGKSRTEAGEWARNKAMHGKDLLFERTWTPPPLPSKEKKLEKMERDAKKEGTKV